MAETRRFYLEVRGGPTPNDLGHWPDPRDPLEVEWRLRHKRTTFGGEVATSDLMVAATYMDAYRALIALPQRRRNQVIEQMKRAMEANHV